ncbi:MAG: hypothetical protein PHT29_05430 [Eubacteriales bacterium]|nr:hypothetical protein [Eubacteriales bacterium]MDD3290308.1 hypothetical protein [Eubacteriales bacterium]MDD3863254.1 hypothetical protein [Eubacteriales bacterium]
MRITNNMITAKYIRSLGTLSYDLDRLNTQVASGRSFMKSSENTSAAVKAYRVRRDLSKAESYQSNIDHAESFLTNTESSLFHMNELVQTAKERISVGLNGTTTKNERIIVATEIRNLQNQLLQTLNTNASEIHLFGGTNTDLPPFEVSGGKLLYNTIDLDTLVPGSAQEAELLGDSLYVDIGLNAQFDPLTGQADKSTVFEYSIPGLRITGSGTTSINGTDTSNNLYNLLGEIATEFESDTFSTTRMNDLFGHFSDVSVNVINTLTIVGSKTSYLEFMTERLETRTLNLQENQLALEAADPAKAIIHFESQKMAYTAALKMGTSIIQPSIFDYIM